MTTKNLKANRARKKIILCEIIQTQRYVLIHKRILTVKQRITMLQSIDPERPGNKKDPTGDS